MNADAMATRMTVLTRALPSRILLVDDDELEVQLMAERLASAGFEVAHAANGEQALQRLDKQWYPLVITDWQMPVMDGIAFTRALRARGIEDTYIIMLTMREASVDYERGYVSGVDDYLSKKVPDAELFVRIHAAFNTLALRRSLRQARAALEQSVAIDAETGAFAASELLGKLTGEIRRAQRYGRQLAIITLGVGIAAPRGAEADAPEASVLRGVVQAVDGTLRAHIDWVSRMEAPAGRAAFAIVLPETGISEAPLVKDRLLMALRSFADSRHLRLELTFGVAALQRSGGEAVDAAEMLAVAGHCRACPGHTSAEQSSAVQRSVASHVAIVCRHGYAIDGECSLKEAAARGRPAASSPAIAD